MILPSQNSLLTLGEECLKLAPAEAPDDAPEGTTKLKWKLYYPCKWNRWSAYWVEVSYTGETTERPGGGKTFTETFEIRCQAEKSEMSDRDYRPCRTLTHKVSVDEYVSRFDVPIPDGVSDASSYEPTRREAKRIRYIVQDIRRRALAVAV